MGYDCVVKQLFSGLFCMAMKYDIYEKNVNFKCLETKVLWKIFGPRKTKVNGEWRYYIKRISVMFTCHIVLLL